MTMPNTTPTREQICTLRCEAHEAGDRALVAICDLALTGEWFPEHDALLSVGGWMTQADALQGVARVLAAAFAAEEPEPR